MTRNLLYRPEDERLDGLLDLRWLLAPAAVLVLALAAALTVPPAPPTTTRVAAAAPPVSGAASEPHAVPLPERLHDHVQP